VGAAVQTNTTELWKHVTGAAFAAYTFFDWL